MNKSRERLFSDDEAGNEAENEYCSKVSLIIIVLAILFQVIAYPFTYSLFMPKNSDNFSITLGIVLHALMFMFNIYILVKFPDVVAFQNDLTKWCFYCLTVMIVLKSYS
jgi:hypothetical protein